MITLRCRICGHSKEFADTQTVGALPIRDWFASRGALCTPCHDNKLIRTNATAVATEQAIGQVEANADDQWRQAAMQALLIVAQDNAEFTADEVWVELEKRPELTTHEPAALGPVFLRAARAGVIVNSGRRRKRSVFQQRHRELTVWVSA